MKWLSRMILFVLAAGASIAPAFIGCDEDDSQDTTALMTAALVQPAPDVLIYSGGTHDGNLGSRSNADAICETAAASFPALSGTQVKKAFISFSNTDRIKDLVPYNSSPVYAVKTDGTTTLIKNKWKSLWNGIDITIELMNALGIVSYGNWWSGCKNDGLFESSASCNSWTTNSSGSSGTYGWLNHMWGDEWLAPEGESYTTGCNEGWVILCVAY